MKIPETMLPEKPGLPMRPFASWPRTGMPKGWFTDGDPAMPEFFREQGFCVMHELLSHAEINELIQETVRLCRNEDGLLDGVPASDPSLSDEEVLSDKLCIHFPHKISAAMRNTLAHPAVTRVLTAVTGPDVKAMQSMLFIKSAGKPGQAWHQDEDFIPTRDRSLTGSWIALDDATIVNGCLWIIPGSHLPGVLWPMEWHGDRRFDCTEESRDFPYSADDEVPVEVKAGSVVFFNGYTLHRSLPNRAPKGYRRALVNHYMSAASKLPWGEKKPADVSFARWNYRDIVLVAGRDPYAAEGLADLAKGFVRPDGASGCLDFLTREPRKYK